MKKLSKYIRKEYLPVKIYTDDLEKITSIFRDEKLEYSIQTDNYKYDDLSELLESTKERDIRSLEIKTNTPFISIEFQRESASLYVSTDEPFATGLFHKIDSIINQAKRIPSLIYSYYFIWTFYAIAILIDYINKDGKYFAEYIDLTFRGISTTWVLWVAYIRLARNSRIRLVSKEHVSTFLDRKRDDLILILISGVIGAILGSIATLLTSKLME